MMTVFIKHVIQHMWRIKIIHIVLFRQNKANLIKHIVFAFVHLLNKKNAIAKAFGFNINYLIFKKTDYFFMSS